jgi:hypothetical protein
MPYPNLHFVSFSKYKHRPLTPAPDAEGEDNSPENKRRSATPSPAAVAITVTNNNAPPLSAPHQEEEDDDDVSPRGGRRIAQRQPRAEQEEEEGETPSIPRTPGISLAECEQMSARFEQARRAGGYEFDNDGLKFPGKFLYARLREQGPGFVEDFPRVFDAYCDSLDSLEPIDLPDAKNISRFWHRYEWIRERLYEAGVLPAPAGRH